MALLRGIIKNKNSLQLFNILDNYVVRTLSTKVNYQQMITFDKVKQNVNQYGSVHQRFIKSIYYKFRTDGSMTSSEALFLLRCCGDVMPYLDNAGRDEITSNVWNLIKSYNVALDVSHFNSLLQAYIDNDSQVNHDEILQLMKDRQIKPNRITYGKLIQHSCKKGDMEGANNILEIMNTEKHSIDENVFNSLIIGNGRSNDIDGALQVLDIMKKKEMPIDRSTYDSLLQVYSELNKFEEFENTLAEAAKASITNSSRSIYRALVEFIIHKNDTAINKIQSIIDYNQPAKVINEALRKLIKVGEYEAAYNVLLRSRYEENTYYSFIVSLLKFTTVDVTLKYCMKLCSVSKFDLSSFGFVAELYAKLNQMNNVVTVFEYTKSNNINILDALPVRIVNSMDKKAPTFFEDILKLMKCDTEITAVSYSLILNNFDMTDPMKTFTWLTSNLNRSVNLRIKLTAACFIHLLSNDRLDDAVDFVINTGGFYYILPIIFKYIASQYVKHPECVEKIAEIAVLLRHSEIQQRSGDAFGELLAAIENRRAEKYADENIILQLLKSMASIGISLRENDIHVIKKYYVLHPEEEKIVINMIDAVATPAYRNIISETSKCRTKLKKLKYSLNNFHMDSATQKLVTYITNGQYQEAEDMYKATERPSYDLSRRIGSMYNKQGKHKDAVEVFNSMVKNNYSMVNDVQLNQLYMESMVSIGNFTEAATNLNFIHKTNALSHSFVKTLANLPPSEGCTALLDNMKEKGLLKEKHLVLFDIFRNDLKAALEKMKIHYAETEMIPFKDPFYKLCIESEQPEMLQQLHDFLIEKLGKTTALHHLGCTFLKLNKINQAAHVFQTLGFKTQPGFIVNFSMQLANENQWKQMEGLLKVVTDIPPETRIHLYQLVIENYMKTSNADKALEYWTCMQDENLQFSDTFTAQFGEYLQGLGREAPFAFAKQAVLVRSVHQIVEELTSSCGPDNYQNVKMLLEKLKDLKLRYYDKNIIQYLKNNINIDNAGEMYKLISKYNTTSAISKIVYDVLKEGNRLDDYVSTVLTIEAPLPLHTSAFHIMTYMMTDSENVEKIEEQINLSDNRILKCALWNYYLRTDQKQKSDEMFDKYKSEDTLSVLYGHMQKDLSKCTLARLNDYINRLELDSFRQLQEKYYKEIDSKLDEEKSSAM